MEQNDSGVSAAIDNLMSRGAAMAEYVNQRVEVPLAFVPEDFDLVSLEQYLLRPRRKRGNVNVFTKDSLVEYCKRHIHSAESVIYCNATAGTFVVVLNDHGETECGHGDHRATYKVRYSQELTAWRNQQSTAMKQTDFGEFIEEHIGDIIVPSGAKMLQVALSMRASTKVSFNSAQRLDNGETQFTYDEKIDARAGERGTMKVPERFVLAIPIFEGGDVVELECKLRYRINEGNLRMWFTIHQLDRVLREQIDLQAAEIRSELSVPLIHGSPAGD